MTTTFAPTRTRRIGPLTPDIAGTSSVEPERNGNSESTPSDSEPVHSTEDQTKKTKEDSDFELEFDGKLKENSWLQAEIFRNTLDF